MTATAEEARQRADVVQEWLHTNVPHFARELLAGGAAGAIAKTCVAPLERTKILLMTGKSQASAYDILRLILAREGIAGLFRGNGACCLRIVPYAAIHFSVYEVYRRLLADAWLKYSSASSLPLSAAGVGGDGGGHSAPAVGVPENGVASESSGMATRALVGPDGTSVPSDRMSSQTQPAEAGAVEHPHSADDDTASGIAAVLPVSVASSLDLSASPAITDLTETTASTTSNEGNATAQATPSTSTAPSCCAHTQPAPGCSSHQLLVTQHSGGSSTVTGLTQPHHGPNHQHKHHRLGPGGDLLAGSGAGATAVLLTYPLDMVRTRLAWTIDPEAGGSGRGSSTGLRGASAGAAPAAGPLKTVTATAAAANKERIGPLISHIVRQEGLLGLYRGLAPTLYGIMPYAGLKFFVYGWLKQRYWESLPQSQSAVSCGGAVQGSKGGDRLPVPYMLAFGGVSGLLAQTMTYPLDVVRRRMQVHGAGMVFANAAATSLHAPKPTTWGTTMAIVEREGLRGLFRGLSINYVKVVPSTAIGFTTYDLFKSYLGVGSSR